MIYFSSDHHIGHDNIIRFCNRPFKDITDMNNHCIEMWNNTIGPEDEIYYLGDFSYKISKRNAKYFLQQLNGKKYMIKGNHDRTEYLNNFKNINLIEWWDYSHDLTYEHNGKSYNFSLSHYPHYPAGGSDTICLHGHVHGIYEHHGTHIHSPNVLDVGVDNVGYAPLSIVQIIEFIERRKK